jgi:hypothetical protein
LRDASERGQDGFQTRPAIEPRNSNYEDAEQSFQLLLDQGLWESWPQGRELLTGLSHLPSPLGDNQIPHERYPKRDLYLARDAKPRLLQALACHGSLRKLHWRSQDSR